MKSAGFPSHQGSITTSLFNQASLVCLHRLSINCSPPEWRICSSAGQQQSEKQQQLAEHASEGICALSSLAVAKMDIYDRAIQIINKNHHMTQFLCFALLNRRVLLLRAKGNMQQLRPGLLGKETRHSSSCPGRGWGSALSIGGVGYVHQARLLLADVPVETLGQALEPVIHQVVATDGRHRIAGCGDFNTVTMLDLLSLSPIKRHPRRVPCIWGQCYHELHTGGHHDGSEG